MKQKYSLSACFLFALLTMSTGISRAQNANPRIHSVQYKPPVPNKENDLLKDATEDVSKRTLHSSVYKTKNGRFIAHYSKALLNYPDANGNLQPVDLTLHSDSRGWVADKQPRPCYFHSDRSTAINIGGNFELTFNKNCTVNGMALDQQISSMQNNVVKLDLSMGVHKELNFVPDGIKTNYIFDNALEGGITVAEDLEFPAGCILQKDDKNGEMKPEGWDGDYELLSSDGKLLATFKAAECYDAQKHLCYATYNIGQKDGKTILKTSIPQGWLAKASYPVTLDPLVIGDTAHYAGGTFSCLYPDFYSDSILVTIPPKITITFFTIDYAYVTNTSNRGIPLSDGIFYLNTPCARTDTLSCIDDTAGICYLIPMEDFHNPFSCCFNPSCSPVSFYLDSHLSRYQGGNGCDSSTVWYSGGTYAGYQYFFSAWIEGYTDSVSSLTYTPSSQCSNSCKLDMRAVIQFGVPPYTVTHPWASGSEVVGSYSSCASEGITNMTLTIPGANCPFVCLSPDTIITVPPPTVVDACGDTVKNLKSQTVTLKPVPVINMSPDTNVVCSGTPVILAPTSCVPGTTFTWVGSDNTSGSGNVTDNTTNFTQSPLVVKYIVVGSANGCNSNPDTATGIINPVPIVVVSPGVDTIPLGTSVSLKATGGVTYSWTPSTGLSCSNCSNPVASPTTTTTYSVVATDSGGCQGEIVFTIFVVDENISIPNVVTPNSAGPDGVNNMFFIQNLQYYQNSKLTIYDRWGKQIYTTNDYQNNYNGGGQSDGVYYYLLTLPTGKKYKGFYQLIN